MPNLQPIRPALVGIGGRLRDDCLDLFGDDDTTGRSTDADLRAGRRSYAVSALLAAADETQRAVVESALGDPYCPADTIEHIREPARLPGVDGKLCSGPPPHSYGGCMAGRVAGWPVAGAVGMPEHRIGTQEEFEAAREELPAEEKKLTRRSDELARKRRELPWVPVEKDYRFETADGTKSLADLFGGRSQLLVHHVMFGPPYEAGCPATTSTPAASMLAAI
ncbi:DUF899 family protein [Kitasatospora sp. NPDC085879]|uniref:DUF899 family protein n=1 Tax=Kitasatospora sp. NPDC085879 TaxID=3154769 RepID=UPI00342E3422